MPRKKKIIESNVELESKTKVEKVAETPKAEKPETKAINRPEKSRSIRQGYSYRI